MASICYNNKDRMQAGLIVGGWDPYDGGQIYEIPLGKNFRKTFLILMTNYCENTAQCKIN